MLWKARRAAPARAVSDDSVLATGRRMKIVEKPTGDSCGEAPRPQPGRGIHATVGQPGRQRPGAGQPYSVVTRGPPSSFFSLSSLAAGAGESWTVAAAGPTTSMREEPYEPYVINTYQPGAIMGKGGMGKGMGMWRGGR